MTDNLEKGYSLCWNRWALDFSIKGELGLLLIISSLTAKEGYCFASNSYFAELFGISETSISKKIKKLEEKGYISIYYKRRGCEIISREIRVVPITSIELTKVKPSNEEKLNRTNEEKLKENNISINNINSNINSYPDGLTEKKEDKRSSETSDSLFPDFPDDVPRETKKKSKKKNTNLKDDDFYKPIYDQYREVFFANFSGIPNCGKYKDFTDKCISKFRDQGYNDEQIQQFIILAIKNSVSDKFCMSKRLPFAMIVSDTVMPRLVDSKANDSPSFGVDFNGQDYSEVF